VEQSRFQAALMAPLRPVWCYPKMKYISAIKTRICLPTSPKDANMSNDIVDDFMQMNIRRGEGQIT
jgi:hypothetical protein